MTTSDHLRGPWQAVLSVSGDIYADFSDLHGFEEVDISICRASACPVRGEDGITEWPRSFRGDDMIELFEDLEHDEAQIRWVQAQAMAAGLNAAGGAA
jgi:hypothetical protein